MNTKNPIRYYLAQSMRKNGKLILLATVGVLAVGLILAIGRTIPPIDNLLSEELSFLLVANIALKIILIMRAYLFR